MTAVTFTSREIAIERAKLWLEGLSPKTKEAKALRSLGLLCCQRLRAGLGLRETGGSKELRLPRTAVFVTMDRAKTLALCRSISQASMRARRMEPKEQERWSEMFGSVALSYARAGDPSTTASLLRASAQLGLKHQWLSEVECFLVDQQTPEGCFGLFARELAMVGGAEALWMAHLNFTVEVLWALAEVMALHAAMNKEMAMAPKRRTSAPLRLESSDRLPPSSNFDPLTPRMVGKGKVSRKGKGVRNRCYTPTGSKTKPKPA